MNEIVKQDSYLTTSSLSKLGVSAVGYTAAGIGLFLLTLLKGIPWIGVGIGALVTIFGIAALGSKDKADKKAGIIITAAGALALISQISVALKLGFIGGLSNVLLGVGVFGLLAAGLINAIKFFRGLKKRS